MAQILLMWERVFVAVEMGLPSVMSQYITASNIEITWYWHGIFLGFTGITLCSSAGRCVYNNNIQI
jgi:hypothetical protein